MAEYTGKYVQKMYVSLPPKHIHYFESRIKRRQTCIYVMVEAENLVTT
jgi:hypothetical protein